MGVILKLEELQPDVFCNVSEQILLKVFKRFAEDLTRNARAVRVFKGHFSEANTEISIEDVQGVLKDCPKFKVLSRKDELLSKY